MATTSLLCITDRAAIDAPVLAANAPNPKAANAPNPKAANAPNPKAANAPNPKAANAPNQKAANAPKPKAAEASSTNLAAKAPSTNLAATWTDATLRPQTWRERRHIKRVLARKAKRELESKQPEALKLEVAERLEVPTCVPQTKKERRAIKRALARKAKREALESRQPEAKKRKALKLETAERSEATYVPAESQPDNLAADEVNKPLAAAIDATTTASEATPSAEHKKRPRGKRGGRKHPTPSHKTQKKRAVSSPTEPSSDAEPRTTDLQVTVITEPYKSLSLEQARAVEQSIDEKLMEHIMTPGQHKVPAFRGKPFHSEGGLKMWCEDEYALEWLRRTVVNIPSPRPGTRLTVKRQREVPRKLKSALYVPRLDTSNPGEVDRLRIILTAQNPWYDVNSWTLYHAEEQGKTDPPGLFLVLGIPVEDVQNLMRRDRRVAWRTGSIYVRFFNEDLGSGLHNEPPKWATVRAAKEPTTTETRSSISPNSRAPKSSAPETQSSINPNVAAPNGNNPAPVPRSSRSPNLGDTNSQYPALLEPNYPTSEPKSSTSTNSRASTSYEPALLRPSYSNPTSEPKSISTNSEAPHNYNPANLQHSNNPTSEPNSSISTNSRASTSYEPALLRPSYIYNPTSEPKSSISTNSGAPHNYNPATLQHSNNPTSEPNSSTSTNSRVSTSNDPALLRPSYIYNPTSEPKWTIGTNSVIPNSYKPALLEPSFNPTSDPRSSISLNSRDPYSSNPALLQPINNPTSNPRSSISINYGVPYSCPTLQTGFNATSESRSLQNPESRGTTQPGPYTYNPALQPSYSATEPSLSQNQNARPPDYYNSVAESRSQIPNSRAPNSQALATNSWQCPIARGPSYNPISESRSSQSSTSRAVTYHNPAPDSKASLSSSSRAPNWCFAATETRSSKSPKSRASNSYNNPEGRIQTESRQNVQPNPHPPIDIDSLRRDNESDEQWGVRRRFLMQHRGRYDQDELVTLSQLYTNLKFLDCRYPQETMSRMATLSPQYQESRRDERKRTFVQASGAAEHRSRRQRRRKGGGRDDYYD